MRLYKIINIFAIIATCIFLTACGNTNDERKNIKVVDDSLTITVAVFPSIDALPLMIANDWGVLDSVGIAAKFEVYRSQMDAEKALVEGKADVAMTDLMRTGWWQWQKKPVRFIFATKRPLQIVPNKVLRISKIDQLDDRMIALSRYSQEDYYCDKIVNSIAKRKGQILRPQINSVELRVKMLTSGQLDAVILPQMQAYKAKQVGYSPLKVDVQLPDGFAGFAINTNSIKKKDIRINKLEDAYNLVVAKLNKMSKMPILDDITRDAIFLDMKTDSMIIPNKDFAFTMPIDLKKKSEVVVWLKERRIVGSSYSGDTISVK